MGDALWDRHERTLWIARDRLGKKPLYYGRANGVFLWGSELKALRAHPACPTGVSPAALASFAYVPSPQRIYEGLQKLLPGSYARVRAGEAPQVTRYWDPRDVVAAGRRAPSGLDDADAVEELDALLRDATRRRMVADVPLGAFLSGGIDSSAVVSLMQAESARPVRTFTIGLEEAGYDEAQDCSTTGWSNGRGVSRSTAASATARASVPCAGCFAATCPTRSSIAEVGLRYSA